ncbi:MAG: DUF4249 family protein [Saprospiraceae bacterium]|nr:DUF4249 family protein [Saprospiraceae bacterium]
MKKFTLLSILIFLLTFNNCFDPYAYETANYQSKVIVEGIISNLPESSIIKLFKSEPYLSDKNTAPVRNALVEVIESRFKK